MSSTNRVNKPEEGLTSAAQMLDLYQIRLADPENIRALGRQLHSTNELMQLDTTIVAQTFTALSPLSESSGHGR